MSRRLRRSVATLAAGLLAAGALATAAPADAAPAGTAPAAPVWVRAVPLCAKPAPGNFGCLAQVLQRSTTRTTGAVPASTVTTAGAGPANGYTPAQLATAYGVDPTVATTQVVAVVAAYGNPRIAADLARFDRQYRLPAETATSFVVYNQRGLTRAYPPLRTDWAGEQTLDVQAVRGICHTCRILLVQADSEANADLAAAENTAVRLGATVVTNSFGDAEPVGGRIDPKIVKAFDHPGVVITAGSGDDGWNSWDLVNGGGAPADAPFYPASLATVVSVGGTALTVDANGGRATEEVWNDNGPSDLPGQFYFGLLHATGGGCSTQVRAPAWQRAVAGWSRTGCGGTRLSADVAAVGSPVTGYDVYNSYATDMFGQPAPGWQTAGGTSLSGPLVAGMWALAGGSGGVAYPAASLYAHLGDAPATRPFDVVRGGTGWCGGDTTTACRTYDTDEPPNTLGQGTLDCAFLPGSATPSRKPLACTAGPGYDGPSGVGTPNGLTMFQPVAPAAGAVR